jgi:hypothetical protein
MVKLNGKGSKTVRHFERHELKRIIKYVSHKIRQGQQLD